MRNRWTITIFALAAMLLTVTYSMAIANTGIRADAVTIRNWCEGESYRNFSPKLLSTNRTQISMAVEISSEGYPTYKILKAINASPVDKFYCEQAVWEASPFRPEWAPNFNGAKFNLDFPQKNPTRLGHNYSDNLVATKNKSSKVVCMHFVPASIAAKAFGKSPASFDVDAPANIVKIPVTRIGSPSLSQFRKDWVEYALDNSEMTPALVNLKSRLLKIKYSNLFSG
ncbi:hypothetical protein KF728_09515 [Candidatus Obscuribacterales bacterium]|nr:hypothetical protein [Candidatus Obscuribacterales bacterium]